MAAQGIGTLWKPVVNVWDLDVGERFWSALCGLPVASRIHSGTFAVLADPDDALGEGMWLLLQQVPHGQRAAHAGTHLDVRVPDVAVAVEQAVAIGATVLRDAAPFPDERDPVLEWAVLEDPFGNVFCLVRWPLDR
jgi:predicted enzyme related to lactoylglutathione lyase